MKIYFVFKIELPAITVCTFFVDALYSAHISLFLLLSVTCGNYVTQATAS